MTSTAQMGSRERPWLRWGLCAVLTFVGAGCLATTAGMNVVSGGQLADSLWGQRFQMSSTLLIDLAAAALAIVVCGLLAQATFRTVISGLLLGVILFGFMSFSTKNVIGFGARERMEKSLRVEANSKREIASVEKENLDAAGRHERRLSWLHGEYKAARKTEDKERMLKEVREAEANPPLWKAVVVKMVMADPEAVVVANFFGWKIEDYMFWNQLALAILLVLGKTLGFGLSAALWPRKVVQDVVAASLAKEEPATAPVALAVAVAPAEVPVEAPALVIEQQSEVEEPEVSLHGIESPIRPGRAAHDAIEEINRVERVRAVMRFLDSEMVHTSHRHENSPTAEVAHQMYMRWADIHAPQFRMSMTAFAKICVDLNVKKIRTGGFVYYGLMPIADMPEMKIAA